MIIIMSKATKKKHVTREVTEEEVRPTGEQSIVKITGGRGNNLHEVETCDGSRFLVSMPTKFRKSVWIKRGDFVIVDPISEGNKVRAEIAHILYPMQIKCLKQEGLWPVEFSESKNSPSLPSKVISENEPSSGDSSDDDSLFQNTNHPPDMLIESSSSEESS